MYRISDRLDAFARATEDVTLRIALVQRRRRARARLGGYLLLAAPLAAIVALPLHSQWAATATWLLVQCVVPCGLVGISWRREQRLACTAAASFARESRSAGALAVQPLGLALAEAHAHQLNFGALLIGCSLTVLGVLLSLGVSASLAFGCALGAMGGVWLLVARSAHRESLELDALAKLLAEAAAPNWTPPDDDSGHTNEAG